MYMGQELNNPPSVEGWHQGVEWIDTGTLMERLNFASSQLGDSDRPGVKAMIDRLYAGRVRFHEPVDQLAPGITLHRVGGHSDGLQVLRELRDRHQAVPVLVIGGQSGTILMAMP